MNGVEGGRVLLQVFDVTGRLMKTLVDRRLPAGAHEVHWDGTTGNGERVAGGLYFYRLTVEGDRTGAPVSARKLLVIR